MADSPSNSVDAFPTVMVVHPREKRSKCTVEPLRGRSDFVFVRFPDQCPVPLDGYVRLGLGGPELSPADASHGLLVLDGTWKLAARMEPFYSNLPVRSLPPVKTAYPRVSQLYEDPADGLATVEAIYLAHRILGRSLDGLLDQYYWKDQFLAMNGWSADEATQGKPALESAD
jgi:pre-rRNA-processing protein TSR3